STIAFCVTLPSSMPCASSAHHSFSSFSFSLIRHPSTSPLFPYTTLFRSLFLDAYTTSRATGSFILIDPFSNATVGAGMVRETFVADTTSLEERNPATRVAAPGDLTAQERHLRHGHKPGIDRKR